MSLLPTSTVGRRRKATVAVIAAVAAAATDWAYLALINSQGSTGPNPGVVPFLVAYIAALAVAAAVGAVLILLSENAVAQTVLASATAGSAALGFLAIFSIGLALIITAGLLASAAIGLSTEVRRSAGWVPPLVGALAAIAILVAGLTLSGVFWGS